MQSIWDMHDAEPARCPPPSPPLFFLPSPGVTLPLSRQTPELSHLTVSQRKITEAEAKMECREMFALGSTAFATPITSWDQKVYNNGDTQFESHRIRQMLINDIWGAPHELHTEVDYSLISHGQGP
mmetsp:Transcript_48213/g.121733  ORF Transcript_48213/g.121733 Transcript_48213/m.121733 type:complete len:126 (-) Transcript_48213:105-482(-)